MIWSFFALAVLILPLRWLLAAMLAAFVHELGHYIALRLCGIPVQGLRIGTGGTIMQVGQMNSVQTVICSLAGPVAGLSLMLLAPWFPRTAVCAFVQSAYNLLPIYPLDGGRVLRAVGPKLYRWVEGGCLLLIVSAGVYGCVCMRLGLYPLLISVFTLCRALAGKGLEKRHGFRYNRKQNLRMRKLP